MADRLDAPSWPARMSRTRRLRGGRHQESRRAASRWTVNANCSLGSPQIDGTEGGYEIPVQELLSAHPESLRARAAGSDRSPGSCPSCIPPDAGLGHYGGGDV